MSKRIIILSIILLLVLSACNSVTPHEYPTPEQIDTQAGSDRVSEIIWIYDKAEADYLIPLDEFSWEREYEPEYIVIHFTSAVVNHRNDPYNEEHLRELFTSNGVSINYIILRDGTLKCYVPEDRVAWHAGKGEIAGEKYTNALNRYSIGIEIAAIGSKNDMSPYLSSWEYDSLDQSFIGFTDQQYEALKLLVDDLCVRYGIPLDRSHIIGHDEYSPTKTDPGELFDWSRIIPEK